MVSKQIPFNFEYFKTMTEKEKYEILKKLDINTMYFAIDGTRRYAMRELKKHDAIFTYDKYFQLMKSALINSIDLLFKKGFTNVFIPIHDNTTLKRGNEYIEKSIKFGMEPLWSDADYLNFYKQNKINVRFVGFNEIYAEIGFPEVLGKLDDLERLTISPDNKYNLLFLTSSSPSEDIVRLANIISQKQIKDKQNIVKEFYGFDIPNLDLSLHYGRPRGKVVPILIDDNELRVYSKEPSFYIDNNLVDQALYFTILHKLSINDEFNIYNDVFVIKTFETEFNPSLVWADVSYSSDLAYNLI